MKEKIIKNGKDVISGSSHNKTLSEVFALLKIPMVNFTLDSLDKKYKPADFKDYDINPSEGQHFKSPLHSIFLEYDNFIKGQYYAEIIKKVYERNQKSEYDVFEYHLVLKGSSINEWGFLADWVINNNLLSDQVCFIVDIKQDYANLKSREKIKNFQEYLNNVFMPLFDVTMNPNTHPNLALLLKHISGFSTAKHKHFGLPIKTGLSNKSNICHPEDWNTLANPPFSYYLYYFFSNISSLNALRHTKSLKHFLFRPSVSSTENALLGFLLADCVYDGVCISHSNVLQYVYFLSRVGIVLNPLLSNLTALVHYTKHPIMTFFRRGLTCSISTGKTLQLHITNDPLTEEYAIAAQMWKFSTTDLCEIARMSILISGFDTDIKKKFLGQHYDKAFVDGNDVLLTNIPNIRLKFRQDCWEQEIDYVNYLDTLFIKNAPNTI